MAHILKQKTKKLVSWQTHEALIVTTHSSVDLKHFLNHQIKFDGMFLSEYFVRQRSIGRRKELTLLYKQYLKNDI